VALGPEQKTMADDLPRQNVQLKVEQIIEHLRQTAIIVEDFKAESQDLLFKQM
jgi:hypothetical protein